MVALNYCTANRHYISGHSKLLGRPELGQDSLPDIFSANILEAATYGCANLLASLADEETQPAYYYMIGGIFSIFRGRVGFYRFLTFL